MTLNRQSENSIFLTTERALWRQTSNPKPLISENRDHSGPRQGCRHSGRKDPTPPCTSQDEIAIGDFNPDLDWKRALGVFEYRPKRGFRHTRSAPMSILRVLVRREDESAQIGNGFWWVLVGFAKRSSHCGVRRTASLRASPRVGSGRLGSGRRTDGLDELYLTFQMTCETDGRDWNRRSVIDRCWRSFVKVKIRGNAPFCN